MTAINTNPVHVLRVLRGGSWFDNPQIVRSASRSGFTSVFYLTVIGFRLTLRRIT